MYFFLVNLAKKNIYPLDFQRETTEKRRDRDVRNANEMRTGLSRKRASQ